MKEGPIFIYFLCKSRGMKVSFSLLKVVKVWGKIILSIKDSVSESYAMFLKLHKYWKMNDSVNRDKACRIIIIKDIFVGVYRMKLHNKSLFTKDRSHLHQGTDNAMALLPHSSLSLNPITELGIGLMGKPFERLFETFYVQNLIIELNCELTFQVLSY